jgi:hypothetical protein
MAKDQLTLWRARLAKDFPDGINAVWEGDEDSPVYVASRPAVLDMEGLSPIIQLPLDGVDKTLDVTVSSYAVESRDPTVVRVALSGVDRSMLWSSNGRGSPE